jgi:seryl-tRNA synthetase
MIDIQLLRDKPDYVKEKSKQKGYDVDVDRVLALDSERLDLLRQVETLRARRNQNAEKMKQSASSGKPDQAVIDEGKQIKLKLAEREELLSKAESSFYEHLKNLPNPTFDDVPIGDESCSIEIKKWGDQKTGAKDHLDFAVERGWVDFEKGAKAAGAKFYYLKGDLALLENAVTQYALNYLLSQGFTYMLVPHIVNTKTAAGAGFAPKSSDESNEYFIEGEDLTLIGTAEAPLTGYHADDIIDEAALPLLYAGYSPCYRKEAGTYGKHSRGLFRVHQFNKLEMYAFALPENSAALHEQILAHEEAIWQAIGIPYHIINIASGDLGSPAAKKYDLEYWSPVDGAYRELTSCSNCTDFQARNLNIRVRRKDGRIDILHTLNGTAVSLARSLVAIIEHYQNPDGTLRVPEVLQKYMGGRETL